ncbi:hypothetical protein [Bacillus cereus]|uniref:hypothetical protein n=1 Tax=Bacillus cereus TaxID=1396 RepID=UPI002405553A|nr:hypothetical protein [Bacillus cereus]MDF9638811.1 hypothetical protein [Bacillus cereus]
MKKQLNIIEALGMPVGTKLKITDSKDRNFIGEMVVIREFGSRRVKALYHISPRGSENKLAATEMMVTTKFEEHIVEEFVQTDFTALSRINNKQVFYYQHGEYHELCIYKDLRDLGINDTDDLQRTRKFFHKKVNGEYVTK